jgi:hypothetical protein
MGLKNFTRLYGLLYKVQEVFGRIARIEVSNMIAE